MLDFSTVQKRLFAWGMGRANAADAHKIKLKDCPKYQSLGELKQSLLGNLEERVLEIGPGAGASLSYYPKDIEWIGIEPNAFMHSYLATEAKKQGLSNIQIHQGTAENLPVENESIDAVVSTHVLCSVQDPSRSLREIKRILKPGGKFIFIEHVAAQSGTWTRRVQDGLKPVWKTFFDNCHTNRETGGFLQQLEWEILDYREFRLNFPVVSPHIAGVMGKI